MDRACCRHCICGRGRLAAGVLAAVISNLLDVSSICHQQHRKCNATLLSAAAVAAYSRCAESAACEFFRRDHESIDILRIGHDGAGVNGITGFSFC